ncbi:glycosyltransferase family 4 protein [Rhizobium sp. CAU 1783]
MMRRLRINIVLGPFFPVPPVRGLAVERRQYAMALEYARRGHAVTMLSRRFAGLPRDELENGIRHIRLPSCDPPPVGWLYRLIDVVYCLFAAWRMPPADVTITNSVAAPILLPLRKAGRIAVSVGRHPKGQMRFYRRAARFHAASHHVAETIGRQTPEAVARVRVVPNPLSHDFARAAGAERGCRDREIVYLGRLSREKGIDLLLKAFEEVAPRFPDWRLTIIGPSDTKRGGDGPDYLAGLKALACNGNARTAFEPPIYDGEVLVDRLRRAAVFVYPSVAEKGEAFGLAPLEAMACGCAVVVSALDCFRDYLVPGENGLVFDHREGGVANLAECLKTLLEDGVLRERLADAARDSARHFTPERIADLMLADLSELAAR